MGLKSFCPWCLKLGGNTKTIAIHLWEVHYRMAVMCNICQAFAGMSAQSILDHHSGFKLQNVTRNVWSMKGLQKPLRKKKVLWTKEHIPLTQSRCCQEVIKSGMPLYIFCLVKLVNVSQFTPWIFLDHPRLFFKWTFTQLRWTVIPFIYWTMVLTSNNH